jgi:single-stranded DNA-binding protein
VHDDAPTVDAAQPTTVDINAVILTGYLVTDPEARPTRNGGSLTVLRLAIPRVGALDYIDVLTDSELAEVARQLSKGQRVLVTGQLRQQRWTTKKGTTRCKHAIAASTLEPLPSPPGLPNPGLTDPPHPLSAG